MSPASARCSAKPYCYCSLQDICQVLQQLAARATALLAADAAQQDSARRIRQWCDAREQGLGQVLTSLETDPETAALLGDWLSHAPMPLAVADGSADDFLALCRDVAALEEHLLLLFGTLMQQGDSAWARQVYRELLDQRAPLPAVRLPAARPVVRPCPPSS